MFYGVTVDELLIGEKQKESSNNEKLNQYINENKGEQILKKLNTYFLVSISTVVISIVSMLILTTILRNLEKPIWFEKTAVIIINISFIVSIALYIYGNYEIKNNVSKLTDFSIVNIIKKKNRIFSDVMFVLMISEITIFGLLVLCPIIIKLAFWFLFIISYFFIRSYFIKNETLNYKNLNTQIQKIMLMCEILLVLFIFNFIAKNISFVPDDYLNINLLFSTDIVRKYVFRIASIIIMLISIIGLIIVKIKKKYILSYPLLILGILGNALIFCDVFITWNDNTMKELQISSLGNCLIVYYVILNIILLICKRISKKQND